ncbi:hypothetical protein DSCO28_20560 [Desulfosarcina ovata subsp. sediminis]|uniref:Uncharacterized protein n=2 Tax=Desulfosarcina ovata TaxID=83564 RepID=A0A5K8A9N6_9BACT|nr:hypothetical protein DSCO28_20560 [Desulfosarcina ovata subsp. sediminis]BBO88750.1 hypothetical protein DSCOOX_19300 [Desulfosarcina ovata subsp. ovata]
MTISLGRRIILLIRLQLIIVLRFYANAPQPWNIIYQMIFKSQGGKMHKKGKYHIRREGLTLSRGVPIACTLRNLSRMSLQAAPSSAANRYNAIRLKTLIRGKLLLNVRLKIDDSRN